MLAAFAVTFSTTGDPVNRFTGPDGLTVNHVGELAVFTKIVVEFVAVTFTCLVANPPLGTVKLSVVTSVEIVVCARASPAAATSPAHSSGTTERHIYVRIMIFLDNVFGTRETRRIVHSSRATPGRTTERKTPSRALRYIRDYWIGKLQSMRHTQARA